MRHQPRPGDDQPGTYRPDPDANETHTARPLGQDLRHALGKRLKEPGLGQSGRQVDRLGLTHYEQGARHPVALQLGHDLRLCSVRQFRRVRWPGQHLFDLQPQEPRG